MRQVEFGLFDMLLHAEAANQDEFMAVLEAVRASSDQQPTQLTTAWQHTSVHIFAWRLRGELPQLQVGGSAVGRRLRGV